ncbi:MAG TPA: hypothetical protein VNL74_02895 [Methylococcus sp.]|nr:hypothetical protein [Methylococcus sp.]
MRKFLIVGLVLGLIGALPAWAGKDGAKGKKGKAKPHPEQRLERSQEIHPSNVVPPVSISIEQRTIIYDYYDQNYRAHGACPPGLAKKGTACLPPGQAKKRSWGVGQRLPSTVVIQPLPPELVLRLGLPPTGYAWGYVGGRIVLYALATRLIVDLVDALY